MGWPINNSNSFQFKVGADQFALGMLFNEFDDAYILGLFRLIGSEWIQVKPIAKEITSATVMAAGSVSAYILAQLPIATAALHAYLLPVKPDVNDKPACVGYDFAFPGCIAINENLTFSLAMNPPLPHAR